MCMWNAVVGVHSVSSLMSVSPLWSLALNDPCYMYMFPSHSAGDYVVVEPIAEGNKVQAEIVHILFPRQIKHLKQQELW